ncbi:MAG: tRNA 2-selenouridine(34) synthase MnmH [Halioglobus sp.]|nr:tRNA 2-selenouridine(34) synthase MnmH [Halioglobus sp.]
MPAGPETDDYRALFLQHTPMIDLRAPAEFARGAFPGSASLPLMTDEERAQVGICYKEQGQAAAIELGHKLVGGATRTRRLERWLEFTRAHPQGYLYCWRGGLRSETVQYWLADAGVDYPRISGGYKAMRRFLLDELQGSLRRGNFILVSGKTGTGKTRVIERLARSVDLEGLANHRGSTFGQMPSPQPAQIDFENALAIALLRLLHAGDAPIFLEDEGRLVGRIALPAELRDRMSAAPLVLVEESLASRVEVVLEDYVYDLGRRYALLHGEEGAVLHAQKLQSDLQRIRKRLGGERFALASDMLRDAFEQQWQSGDAGGHRGWIAYLLQNYYDPMYQYQLEQRGGTQLFCGSRAEVLDWARGGGGDVAAA